MRDMQIDNLIAAFTFPYDEITYYFLWDKKNKKVIEISLWDYNDHEEAVLEDEEIVNAIRNTDKNYIDIPRLTIDERIQMMREFATTIEESSLRSEIHERIESIVQSTIKYDISHLKKRYLKGIDMASLTYDLSNEVSESWQTFFHNKTKDAIYKWFQSENLSSDIAYEKYTKE